MASIKKRINTKTGKVTWQAQVRRKGYPPESKNFNTEQEANDWAILTEAALLRNEAYNPSEKRKWTIPEVIDWYIKNPDENRRLETKKHFNRLFFLKEEFKGFTVKTLNAHILKKWIQKRLEINAPATVYHYYVALKNVMMHHALMHRYNQDIFKLVKCPTASGQRDRRFGIEETAILFKYIKSRCRVKQKELMLTVLFSLETACRIGEMLRLKWAQVNLEYRYIDFLAPTTKTKVMRRVPLTTTAVKILKTLKKLHNKDNKKDLRVFHFYNISEHHLSRQFKICCNNADIKNIRWHDLRHEATSRFYERGIHLTDAEIAQITGHKSMNMLKRYAHLRPSSIIKKLW